MPNTVQLYGFAKGVIGKYSNHLNFPQDALVDGSNYELSNGGLESRKGYLYHSDQTNPSSKLPVGTVKVLQQVRFPTHGATFLVAQVVTATTNKLYYCKADLQIDGDADWTELYDLGTGAGTISMAVLGDRVIMTEGVNKPPLVWGGSVETDGSDWQTPKNVILSWDDENFHDATANLTDPDGTTTEGIAALDTDDGAIYVCCDQATISGLYFNMGTPTTDCGLTFKYWSGSSWASIGAPTDGTSGLSQDGVVTWTAITASSTLVADVPGFFIKIVPTASVAAGTTISESRFQAPCQYLQNIGDGQPDITMACFWQDYSTGGVHDLQADLVDYTIGTYKLLNDGNPDTSVAEPFQSLYDAWYFGYPLQFNALEIDVHGDFPNTAADTFNIDYWNGTTWSSLSGVTDGTATSGVPLNHKGKISWTMPTDWKRCRPLSQQYPLGYYVRIWFGTWI